MNARRGGTSAWVQRGAHKTCFENGANPRRNDKNQENTMLRTFAAALLATALIAGPALAQTPGAASSAPAATAPATSGVAGKTAVKPVKSVKTIKHARHHVARHKAGKTGLVRHTRLVKHRHHHLVAHIAKPGKGDKSTRG
jgi:hypothetical protein